MASAKLNLSTVKEENCTDTLLACRICLASDVKLFNIRDWGLEQVFVDLMGTTVSEWDGLPQHVCVFCRALLLRGRELRTRCRRAERLLRDQLQFHLITTSYIKSIDRNAHKLAHTLSHDCKNRYVKTMKYEDTQTDEQTHPNSCVYLIETTDENDDKHLMGDYDDAHFDANLEMTNIENIATPQNTPEVNTVESYNKTEETVKKQVKERYKKTVKKNVKSNKTETKAVKNVEKKPRPAKRKGHAWRRKEFSEEDGFKEFEEKYNFKILSLSEEEMVKEMEDRKESGNYKRSVFKCELCFKGFLSQNTFSNHMKAHDPGRGQHECRLCRVRYLFPTNVDSHLQDAHRLKFRCGVCAAVVRRKASAVLHAAFHAGTTFKCDHCDLQFLKVTSRSSHMRMMHPSEIADGGTCELCGESFVSAVGLKAHKARSHEAEAAALPHLRCRACKLRFESQPAIERHRNGQPGGKCGATLSCCTRCGEVCATQQELLTHRMQQHGLQLFTCDMCNKTFESKESVATHIDRVHKLLRAPVPPRPGYSYKRDRQRATGNGQQATGNGQQATGNRQRATGNGQQAQVRGRAVCEQCGKRVSCMAVLKVHMNRHTGERPFNCTLCPKAYMSPNALNFHMESHSSERKWRCQQCPAAFMHQSSLYQHRKIHTGEKAYQCHICSKTFTQSGTLQTHIKYVHMKIKPPPRKRNKKTAA